jgi:uncharacterized protein (TIGR02302 family)
MAKPPSYTAEQISAKAMKSVETRLRLTRASMVLERLVRNFWQPISWALLIIAVLRVGLLADTGRMTILLILGVAAVAWVYLVLRGVQTFRLPTQNEAIQRLDQSLPGRPLQTLGDRQAIGRDDPAAQYLWARHIQRMAQAARDSKAAKPDLRLASRDPWGLRLMAIFLCAAAVLFARVDPVQTLLNKLNPKGEILATGPGFEGWAEPPAYTGKPAIYLNKIRNGTTLELPEGTKITLRVYGGNAGALLSESVTETGNTTLPEADTDVAEVHFEIAKAGDIHLSPPRGPSAGWTITMIPDNAPTVALAGEVSRTVEGALKIPFQAKDDYGVSGGEITITLQLDQVDRRYGLQLPPEPRPPVRFDLPMPFNRNTTDFSETVIEDLARHPWAGLPVRITLSVHDDKPQTGAIAPLDVAMPGKRFFDKLAAALAEQRRDLLWNRKNAPRVALLLRTISHQPETVFDNSKAYLMVRSAIRRLEYNNITSLSDDIRNDVADLLWRAALLIEDGDLANARERMKRAQERLSDAMEKGATKAEIADLMEELRKATRQYMRQLAQEQKNKPEDKFARDQPSMTITQDQIQQMMDRIQELMEQGRMDEAQDLMQQFQQMMENMQVTANGKGDKGPPGEQDMENLQDTLRQQQELADETFRQRQQEFNDTRRQQAERQGRQMQEQRDQGNNRQGGKRDSDQQDQNKGNGRSANTQSPGRGGAGLSDLADRQQALRDLLSERRSQMQNDGSEFGDAIEKSLQDAERQMGQAQEELNKGNTEGALDNQADAMESLREGMRQIQEANRQANGQQKNQGQGQQGAQSRGQAKRDPLGRGTGGGRAETDGPVNTEGAYRRSRELMDEIRKRSGERNRPVLELDYLKRLLDRF